MNLAGLGIVFPGGAGMPALREVLSAGLPLVGEMLSKEQVPVLKVPAAALTGSPVLAPARRADRFCKMTLLAATEALLAVLDTWPVSSEELEAVYRSAVAAVDRAKGRETK